MNNKERLSRLIAQYQKNMEFYRNAREFNEQDCRDEFISPLLESFGWDVHNEKGTSPQYKEVVVEKFSNSGDRPDYTLTLNGVSKIFVEAKKPAVNIKEEQEPAIQARRYGWNAKHKLSILTNFEDMMIYDVTNKPQDGDSATVSLYRKYHYLEYLCNIKPFEWSMINSGSRFDAIIGNPPYVKTEDIHTLETEAEFAVYKKKYKSAYKQFDKYFLFLEEAFNLLKENGQMCYIVPNKFYKIGAGQELRRIISKHVSKLDDFGDMQLFPDKTIYSCIITLCKESSKQMEYTNVTSLIDLWTGEEQESIRIKNELLDENPWRLTTDIKFMKMIATAEENGKPLGEIVNIFNGIQTSAERPKPVYWFDKDEIVSETEEEIIVDKFEKRYHIEKRILKPFFKPTKADEKGMGTYSLLKTDKHIIFPYNADGSLINVEIMKKEYPGTYQYLQDCYDLLVPKCLNGGKGRDIKNATADTWYQYGRTQALTAFVDTPKLIVRILSKEPMYAYDENDMLIASGGTAGYCAIAKLPGSKYDLRYIQAWLNHPYTEKLFQIMGSDFEGGFTARGTYLLKKIPFVELDFDDEKQKALYESVIISTKKINELNIVLEQKKDKASISVIEAEKENLSKQIEDNITKIYNLQF